MSRSKHDMVGMRVLLLASQLVLVAALIAIPARSGEPGASGPPAPLEFNIGQMLASENVEAETRIGDDIVVLGNAEGARVIQPLAGKLVGIGPDRIEVTAEFLPGNSGSPIVHVKSGKVIGVASYTAVILRDLNTSDVIFGAEMTSARSF